MEKITIGHKEKGIKLGNFLKKRLNMPTSLVHKLLRKKKIKINGLRPDLNWILKEGWELKIFADLQKKSEHKITPPPQFYKKHFQIIYEDENVLAINKKPDIVAQPTRHEPLEKSLIGLAEHYGNQKGFIPKLLHRLDKNTSGVILIAKTTECYESLYRQFETRQIQKKYLALCQGKVEKKQIINKPIPDNKGHIVSAETEIIPKKNFKECTLIEAFPKTGRFHQIRVHLKGIGHAIIGDELYGDFKQNRDFAKKYGLKRHFLHASSIAFFVNEKKKIIEAPLAKDLEEVLKKIK